MDAQPFDVVFSMESLYYSPSVPDAISKVYSLLVPGGTFVCGTDYYAENPDTAGWADTMDVTMHMYAESEWLDMFKEAGFRTSATRVTDPDSDTRWKRDAGTLFITGVSVRKSKIAHYCMGGGEPERDTLPRQRKLLPPGRRRGPEMGSRRRLATAQRPTRPAIR